MRILGTAEDGRTAADFALRHGDDPRRALARRGWRLLRPLAAYARNGEIELTLEVRPAPEQSEPDLPTEVPRAAGVPADAIPLVRHRIAAYALVTSERGLLATEFSDRTSAQGRWGLAGGGIDAGEQPLDAVLREVVEETSQQVDIDELVAVDSGHWIGPNPLGVIEDFHAVRLIYRAHCPEPTDPVVLDVGGTTSSARWVALARWSELDWSDGWRRLVSGLLS